MQIFIGRDGQRSGPFALEEVNSQLAAGTIKLTDLAWYEGLQNWVALSQVPGVVPPMAPAGSAPVVAPGALPPVVTTVRTEALAIWSLVLSLIGLFACGFFASIPAIICGHLAHGNIKKNPQLQGAGMATAGLVIGYLSIVLWLVLLLVFGGIGIISGLQNHNQ
ncbi:MAG: DUF4190 domain-containing protein [Verrucomicrobiota bacterium]|nr:DUF4190 domain-containing protein [Verrucomicrobiota bacterium]